MRTLLIKLRRGPHASLSDVKIRHDGEVVYTTDINQLYIAKEGSWVFYTGGDLEVTVVSRGTPDSSSRITFRPRYRNPNEIVPRFTLVYSKEDDWMYVGDAVTLGGIKVA